MTRNQILLGLTSIPLSLGLALGPAIAGAAIVKRNHNTGADSTNENNTELRHRERDVRRNRASARNRIEVDADTGNNKSEENTTAGDLESGDVDVLGTLTNDLNPNAGDEIITLSDMPELDVDMENDKTGADSNNKNKLKIDTERTSRVTNRAHVRNNIDVDVETGENQSKKNTEAGDTTSGDVLVDLLVENTLN